MARLNLRSMLRGTEFSGDPTGDFLESMRDDEGDKDNDNVVRKDNTRTQGRALPFDDKKPSAFDKDAIAKQLEKKNSVTLSDGSTVTKTTTKYGTFLRVKDADGNDRDMIRMGDTPQAAGQKGDGKAGGGGDKGAPDSGDSTGKGGGKKPSDRTTVDSSGKNERITGTTNNISQGSRMGAGGSNVSTNSDGGNSFVGADNTVQRFTKSIGSRLNSKGLVGIENDPSVKNDPEGAIRFLRNRLADPDFQKNTEGMYNDDIKEKIDKISKLKAEGVAAAMTAK